MKRIIPAMLMALMANSAFASGYIEEYCPKEPYPIKSTAADIVSNVVGANFIATKTIEIGIQNALKKSLNAGFNIEIYPFNIIDLSDGKFKRITAEASNINTPDFSLETLKAESMCGYNRIIVKNGDIFFAENFLLGYNAKISNTNLRQTVLSTKYLNKINEAEINISGINLFKIKNPDIEIKDNRIHINFNLVYSNFFKTYDKKININSSLKVQDEKIVFSDINVGSHTKLSSNVVLYILNLINPFNNKIKIDENNTAYIKTQKLDIVDNTILTEGVIILKKNYIPE